MIFVTVGTHEQSCNRLIQETDRLVQEGLIKEEVFIQTGYSSYIPRHCRYKTMLESRKMEEYTKMARIVITHGGPGSIMLPFGYGKIPIVVPRQQKYGEHVDDHQVKFTKKLEASRKVIAVYHIGTLRDKIINYDQMIKNLNQNYQCNTLQFVKQVEEICVDLVGGINV